MFSLNPLVFTIHDASSYLYRYMGVWRQIGEYLYIKKRDPNAPRDSYIRAMHGMNRISIFLFLAAILLMLYRLIRHFL